MKILVDKVPATPKECLFKTKIFKEIDECEDHKLVWSYGCILGNEHCDFEKGHKCNKLTAMR